MPDLCVPRPCYFDGQLIGAEDLNATVSHFRSRDLMFGRFVGGWGIYGGLAIEAGPGLPHFSIGSDPQLTPNPQLVLGQTVTISPGVALDAHGRPLVLCSPAVLDLRTLPRDPAQPGGVQPPIGGGVGVGVVANQAVEQEAYFLVAEYEEVPVRPVAQLAGGEACDPAPTCDFSRKREQVRFRLVRTLPEEYEWFGCLDDPGLELPNVDDLELGAEDVELRLMEAVDAIARTIAKTCCSRPAVVLGAVILLPDLRGSIGTDTFEGPASYLLDAYPHRRVVPSAALNWTATLQALRDSLGGGGDSDGGAGGAHAMAQIGVDGELRHDHNIESVEQVEQEYVLRMREPLALEQRVVQVSVQVGDPGDVPPTAVVLGGTDDHEVRVYLYEPSTVDSLHVVVHDTESGGS